MSINSLHQNNPALTGGFYAKEKSPGEILADVLNPEYVFRRNYRNAGNTAFDEATVQTGYMKAMGIGSDAATLIGYKGDKVTKRKTVRLRIRNMGPWKLMEMHTAMKANGLVPPIGTGAGAANGGGTHPIFYAFERLLQLFFEDYEALEIPQRIRNWVPAEGSFWNHWWKER